MFIEQRHRRERWQEEPLPLPPRTSVLSTREREKRIFPVLSRAMPCVTHNTTFFFQITLLERAEKRRRRGRWRRRRRNATGKEKEGWREEDDKKKKKKEKEKKERDERRERHGRNERISSYRGVDINGYAVHVELRTMNIITWGIDNRTNCESRFARCSCC